MCLVRCVKVDFLFFFAVLQTSEEVMMFHIHAMISYERDTILFFWQPSWPTHFSNFPESIICRDDKEADKAQDIKHAPQIWKTRNFFWGFYMHFFW